MAPYDALCVAFLDTRDHCVAQDEFQHSRFARCRFRFGDLRERTPRMQIALEQDWLLGQDSNLEFVSRRINSHSQSVDATNPGRGCFSIDAPDASPELVSRVAPCKLTSMAPYDALCVAFLDTRDHCVAQDEFQHSRFARCRFRFGDLRERTPRMQIALEQDWLLGQDSNLEPFG